MILLYYLLTCPRSMCLIYFFLLLLTVHDYILVLRIKKNIFHNQTPTNKSYIVGSPWSTLNVIKKILKIIQTTM